MDVTVNINAPAIVEAINRLSEVFSAALSANNQPQVIQAADVTPPVQSQITAQQYEVITPQTAPTQPVQSAQQQAANITPPITNAPQNVQQPPQSAPAQPAMTSNPAPAQQTAVVDEAYRNRVCTAAARLIEQGKMPDVLAILQSYGVAAVTQLSATQLPDFANRITALGAVI